MERGVWRAIVHAVAKSWTWLSDLACTQATLKNEDLLIEKILTILKFNYFSSDSQNLSTYFLPRSILLQSYCSSIKFAIWRTLKPLIHFFGNVLESYCINGFRTSGIDIKSDLFLLEQ